MRAYCGIECLECPVFIATQLNDEKLREETVEKWGEDFGLDLNSEDLVCDGCQSERVFYFCKTCPFIACCKEKGIENCGECEDYPCEQLDRFLKPLPDARAYLDKIHKRVFEK